MIRLTRLHVAILSSTVALSTAVAQTGPSSPQEQAQKAVVLRQAVFDVQGFAFGPATALLKGQSFNAEAAVTAGQRIEITSSMIPEVFRIDTSKFTLKTKARAGIWTNMSDFKQKAEGLHDAAMNLVAAAKTGDKSATLDAVKGVGKACSACHDEYKEN